MNHPASVLRLRSFRTKCKLKSFSQNVLLAWKMRASCVTRPPGLSLLPKGVLPLKGSVRIQVLLPHKVTFCRASFAVVKSGVDGSSMLNAVPPTLLTAEKEEAKAVLILFLKKQGLSNAAAARIVKKCDPFIDNLVLRIHSVHKARYLVGRELTTLEIREALAPYLESLLEEYDSSFVSMVQSFPQPPIKKRSSSLRASSPNLTLDPADRKKLSDLAQDRKKVNALARVSTVRENLPQHVLYLLDLGMDLKDIQDIIRKFPAFVYYSLDGKIRPVVEFLLDLGIPQSEIMMILVKRPQLCGISLTENLIPTMKFLEELGLDKSKWAKVICRFPALLTYSRLKLISTVDFFHEMGLSEENIGKLLTRCPNIISYSIENKLRPVADYFVSLGVDVAVILHRSPQIFGLNIETNLKPITAFFLEKGYSLEDIRVMIHRYSALYTFSLTANLIPKWEYFLTMDYPPIELVKFPQYFGYSLEQRIKPRYAIVKEAGVTLLLNQVLSTSEVEFNKVIDRKLKKLNGAVAYRLDVHG